jgi:serine O-acetyltransferase
MKTLFQLIKEDIAIYKNKETISVKDLLHVLNPRIIPVVLFRFSNALSNYGLGVLGKIISFLNFVLFGCDIARRAKIDGGLFLPHSSGVVIGEFATIGKNCIIHQGVTLGDRGEEYEDANPTIGDFVEICTGAKILGKITLDDYSIIGANSVVLKDVPRCAVVVGIPSRVVKYREVI